MQPQQNNNYDCGIFVIQYFKKLLELFKPFTSNEDLIKTIDLLQTSLKKDHPMQAQLKIKKIRREMAMKYVKYVVVIYLKSAAIFI